MNAFVLHDAVDDRETVRWSVSAATIVVLHGVLVALAVTWYAQPAPRGVTIPAIMVDMAPVSSAPQSTPLDLAPGPVMQEADASPPEPARQEVAEEQLAPTPPQQNPEVAAPPEQRVQLAPPTPEPRIAQEQKPAPVKPRVVRRDAKKPTDAPPAPRTSAPPRAERQANAASAPSAGTSASTIASFSQLVAAHLQRFKQYPHAAKAAGQQGVARLSFTLGRGGQVLASRLAGSSGHAALDAETMAMVRRAQPFPSFPPDIKQGTMSFSVPIQFSIR
jgi:protein TonB